MGRRRRPRARLGPRRSLKRPESTTTSTAKRPPRTRNKCWNENLLTTMPSVVVLKILDYLDVPDLKSLRQVCQGTKSWVEQPRYLRQLPVQVKDEQTLAQVLESTVPWANFHFPLRVFPNNGSAQLLLQFRPWLTSVTIGLRGADCTESWTTRLLQNYLLHLGPELESLRLFGHFHLTTLRSRSSRLGGKKRSDPDFPDNDSLRGDPMRLEREQLEGLSFPGLRTLELVPPHSVRPEWICPLVQLFLAACPNLTSIKFPILTMRSRLVGKEEGENPFVAYLTALGQKSRPSKFALDFCSNWTLTERERLLLFCDGLYPAFKLDSSTLIQLAVLCLPIGGKLWNVPLASLPRTGGGGDNLSKFELHALTQSLGSVVGKDEMEGIGNFVVPHSTALSLVFNVKSDSDFSNFVLPTDSLVTDICVTAPWSCLTRPSVTELRLLRETAEQTPFLDSVRLSRIFPNLRRLYLFNAHFANVLQTVPDGLEELYMYKCDVAPEAFYEAEGVMTRRGSWRRLRFAKFKRLRRVKLRIWSSRLDPTLVHSHSPPPYYNFARFQSDFKQLVKGCDIKGDWSW